MSARQNSTATVHYRNLMRATQFEDFAHAGVRLRVARRFVARRESVGRYRHRQLVH